MVENKDRNIKRCARFIAEELFDVDFEHQVFSAWLKYENGWECNVIIDNDDFLIINLKNNDYLWSIDSFKIPQDYTLIEKMIHALENLRQKKKKQIEEYCNREPELAYDPITGYYMDTVPLPNPGISVRNVADELAITDKEYSLKPSEYITDKKYRRKYK